MKVVRQALTGLMYDPEQERDFFGSELLGSTGKLEARCQFHCSAQSSDEPFQEMLGRWLGDGGRTSSVSVSLVMMRGKCSSRCSSVSSGDSGVKSLGIGGELLRFMS